MNKICLLIFLVILMALSALAQKIDRNYIDVIYLENGNIVRGKILEHVKDQHVSIQSTDDNIWRFDYDEIERVSLELLKAPKRTFQQDSKGYFGMISFGIHAANGNPRYDLGVIPGIYTVQGFTFSPYVSAGVSTGLEMLENGLILPVMGDIRGDIPTHGAIHPHFYLQGGYSFALHEGKEREIWEDGQWINENGEASAGLRAGGGVGIRLLTQSSISWMLALGYTYQAYEESYGGNRFRGERIKEETDLHRITLCIGIRY